MKLFLTIVRVLGVVVGLFLLAAAFADVLGWVPYSMEMPPACERLAHGLPVIIAASVLVMPYRVLTSSVARRIVMSLLLVMVARILFMTVSGLRAYAFGEKSWHIVPVSLGLSAIVAANLYACFHCTSRRQQADKG